MSPQSHAAVCLLAVVCLPAFAQSDREVAERAIERSAQVCPGHSLERTSPGVRAVPVAALRVLARHSIVMCPDRRLDADAPAVFYGRAGVFAWNPEVAGAPALVASRIDALTRTEDFPNETVVWSPAGETLRERVVPAFEPREGARMPSRLR